MRVYYSIVIALTIFAIGFLYALVASGPEGVVSYLQARFDVILYSLAFWVPVIGAEWYLRFGPGSKSDGMSSVSSLAEE